MAQLQLASLVYCCKEPRERTAVAASTEQAVKARTDVALVMRDVVGD